MKSHETATKKTRTESPRTPQNRNKGQQLGEILQRVEQAPGTVGTSDILQLQRAIGNHATANIVQTKLRVGPAGDKYEQEADRMADQVMRSIGNSTASAQSVVTSRVQRQGDKSASGSYGLEGGDVDTSLERSIQSARGGGRALDDKVRSSMERSFGADFSQVNVHTGAESNTLNRSLNSRAFTTKNDIFFARGQYGPDSSAGQKLLAHELTHVVQQGGAGVQRQVDVQRAENNTGLPDGLKSGIEGLSGTAMDDVKVHYNSDKPGRFSSAAYTEGSDIHVASGQEKHLPHEAWHAVQQKQGRVKASMQFKGLGANLDSSLEREADVMGAKASHLASVESRLSSSTQIAHSSVQLGQSAQPLQRQTVGTPVRQFACGNKKKQDNKRNAVVLDHADVGDLEDESEVQKYTALKSRHAHYEGEDVDASTNPLIVDGRKGVQGLRGMGMGDDEIRTRIKDIVPSYTNEDINNYLMGDETPKVKYVESTDLADYELTTAGSKLKQKGKNFDTRSMFSSGAGAGYSIFVMSPTGGIYANEHKPGLFHHSSFLAGQPTAAAGEVQVTKGVLKNVTNKSGHYHPGAPQMFQVLQEFQSRGIKLTSFGLKISGIPETSDDSEYNGTYATAKQFYDQYTASTV